LGLSNEHTEIYFCYWSATKMVRSRIKEYLFSRLLERWECLRNCIQVLLIHFILYKFHRLMRRYIKSRLFQLESIVRHSIRRYVQCWLSSSAHLSLIKYNLIIINFEFYKIYDDKKYQKVGMLIRTAVFYIAYFIQLPFII
jgi:hypothetical protein